MYILKKYKCMNVYSHIKLLRPIYSLVRNIMQKHKLPKLESQP